MKKIITTALRWITRAAFPGIISALRWALLTKLPAMVPIGVAVAFLVVGVSQCSTINKRNRQLTKAAERYAQRGDSLAMYQNQINQAQAYYDKATEKQKAKLEQIRRKVRTTPARDLPGKINDNLRAIDSLLRFYDAGPALPGHGANETTPD